MKSNKENIPAAFAAVKSGMVMLAMFFSSALQAQSVTEIITDYNGYYKTGTSAINPVRPDNRHNLLAFSFNGTRYSTGVNDDVLTANGQAFTASDFRALPMTNITGAPTSNTKIGLGAMVDGVYNGTGGPAPSRSLAQYLNDGPKGLDLGTCVANLPAGTMYLSVSNLQEAQVGDGVPDILVTQVADPSTRFDRYSFTDINGNRIGNYVDVNLTNVASVGQWTADFFEATGSVVLASGFTQTSRNMRLWAADFSAFGINASNVADIAYFRIDLSGDSDIAFVAYNATTISINQTLNVPEFAARLTRTVNRDEVKTLKVFPNPAKGSVSFNHPVSGSDARIMIYAINGVLQLQQAVAPRISRSDINIGSLRPGSYQVVYTDGIQKYVEKLIVQ